ncbi:MAG: GAF domain-containing sensor histidine kinase, partial [Patescibacteria group bacterium]
MIVSVIVVLALDPLKRLLSRISDDIFFRDRIDYQVVLQELSIIIAREIDLEILLATLKDALRSKLKLKAADILVKRNHGFTSLATDKTARKAMHSDNPLIEYIYDKKELIITDEFYRQTYDMPESDERHKKQQVLDELERQGIEFCMPVVLEGDLKALIILGQKQSGDIYGNEEVRFFNNLAPQVAVALEKAQLYESIGEFNLKLQDKINKATQKLKDQTIQLQDANAHLKQLDTAKSEFLSIASHQLRTPVSALKGYLSMMLEGDFGTIEPKQRQVLADLFESAARLARLINIFLNVSRIESGRFKLDKTMTDVNALVDSVMKELSGQAVSKGIRIAFVRDAKLPQLYADSDKIREVVLNIIDNAIKYTPHGKIDIKTFQDTGAIHFTSTDTGVGIRPEDAKSLFQKFVGATGIAQVNTQGSGLGLYIAHRVVSEHGGRIW